MIRFHSDDDEDGNGKGFEIEYSTLELFTTCGGNFSNSSGILTSPSHPNPYPHLADCIYLISQPSGEYINISFIAIDIDCQEIYSANDYIEIRDGKYEDSPLKKRFCGNISNVHVPQFMISTQNHFRIR